jgi:hypothetical protein
MSIVMNMSSYVVEEITGTEIGYRDDAMRVDMTPSLQLAIQQHEATLTKRSTAMPANLAEVDVEMFLQAMSACRRY